MEQVNIVALMIALTKEGLQSMKAFCLEVDSLVSVIISPTFKVSSNTTKIKMVLYMKDNRKH